MGVGCLKVLFESLGRSESLECLGLKVSKLTMHGKDCAEVQAVEHASRTVESNRTMV